jgi:enoyl-CoA hydratase
MADNDGPTPTTPETVLVEVAGGVGRITLNAPERLNAVDAPMLVAVADAVEVLDARDDVRVITLTGAGRGFCSGANLSGAAAAGDGAPIPADTLFAGGRAARAITGSATPVVALVNGVAAGIGMSLALAADYVLAAGSASFLLAFRRIGLMPDGGATALVAANVGRARALRMALLAEAIPAATAEQWGLISECCPDDAFDDRAAAVIASLRDAPPLAVAATTAAVNAATLDLETALDREERGQQQLLGTADFVEGARAFLEKRPASFSGR